MAAHDLEEQLQAHHTACYGWALHCCRWDRHEAEDVLQMSYLKVLDGRARFAGRSSLRSWLFGVIRRTAAEHRRQNALRGLRLDRWRASITAQRSAAPDPERDLVRTEESNRILAALNGLPSRQREVLHLVFYQDMTIGEAAQVIGVSLGTARTHYERGKKNMRQLLQRESDE